MYTKVRAAAISMKPVKWDKAANARRLESFFREAARKRAQVAVAPEGVLEGYVVDQIIQHRELAPRMKELAEPIDGPYLRRFQRLARQLKMCLAFGFAERLPDGAYNCAVFIDQSGHICGRHHKTQFAEGYHDCWDFNRIGRRLRAFETPLGKAGFVICNERWNPVITRILVLDGAQVVYLPSFGARGRDQNKAVLARARENGVPIVEANVGVNLIISKGEAVAYQWGCDRVTVAEIEIPTWPLAAAARALEQDYLKQQGPLMAARYRRKMRQTKRTEGRRSAAASAKADSRHS